MRLFNLDIRIFLISELSCSYIIKQETVFDRISNLLSFVSFSMPKKIQILYIKFTIYLPLKFKRQILYLHECHLLKIFINI